MKRFGRLVSVLSMFIVASQAFDTKTITEEEVKFGNNQNKMGGGMFDDELVKSKKSNIGVEPSEEDNLDGSEDGIDSDAIKANEDIKDEKLSDFNDQITDNYYLNNYRNQYKRLPSDDWDVYDKYYFYGNEDEPRRYRKKRNVHQNNEVNVLKRTPRKRAPLHTPLEQLMRARSGLKRSTRMKRELPPVYQEKLAELLTLMAIKEGKEEAENGKYLQYLPWSVQEQMINQALRQYRKQEEDAEKLIKSLSQYKLPQYITDQLNKNTEIGDEEPEELQSEDNNESTIGLDDAYDEEPTFFRKPYQRRSDDTFYPAPSAYQWLLSGQKRNAFGGRWGPIATKRSRYDEEDEEVPNPDLYILASLLNGEDSNSPMEEQLRKRLIL